MKILTIPTTHSGLTRGDHNTQHMRKHIETLARYSGVSLLNLRFLSARLSFTFLRKRLDNLSSYRLGISDNRMYRSHSIALMSHTHCMLNTEPAIKEGYIPSTQA